MTTNNTNFKSAALLILWRNPVNDSLYAMCSIGFIRRNKYKIDGTGGSIDETDGTNVLLAAKNCAFREAKEEISEDIQNFINFDDIFYYGNHHSTALFAVYINDIPQYLPDGSHSDEVHRDGVNLMRNQPYYLNVEHQINNRWAFLPIEVLIQHHKTTNSFRSGIEKFVATFRQ